MTVAADIIKIDAPSSAEAGEHIIVDISVKNIGGFDQELSVAAVYDSVSIPFQFDYLLVAPGQTVIFRGWFTMPNNNVRLRVWSFFWDVGELYQDDYGYVDIALEVVAPPVVGIITRKELEYDGSWRTIPVFSIPQGERGQLHIWGRNDMATTQQMGIYWFVADPEGYVAEEYGPYWEAWPYTGAGSEHGFRGGQFDLNKVGKYTIWVELLMNPDDLTVVDQYIGDLCTVVAIMPEPTFAGFSIAEYTKR